MFVIIIMIIIIIMQNTKSSLLNSILHQIDIKLVNLSMNALRILGSSSDSLLPMFMDFNLDQNSQNYILKKVMSIAIKCTHYIFCRRDESWPNPDSLGFLAILFIFLFYYLIFLLTVFAINFLYHCMEADSQLYTTCY